MKLYTIGFTQKSAETFFETLRLHKIDLLLDIRLNNRSQLAGFTKGSDLAYFLAEICACAYRHCIEFAPTKEILDAYKKKEISWAEYERQYNALLDARGDAPAFRERFSPYQNICLLCSEVSAQQCHRRLAAEQILRYNPTMSLEHL